MLMTATEARYGVTDADTTNDLLAAYDAMMAKRTPEQAAEMARINAEAHCNQTVTTQAAKAYQSDAAGMTAGREFAA